MEHAIKMSNMRARITLHILLLALFLFLFPGTGKAIEQDETLEVLGEKTVETTAGRFPRALSRTPENVTVIGAAEIQLLNAHTLTDILATIPGIQLENVVGPASAAFTHIQGSGFNQVLVLLDGVPFNNLGDNFSDIGLIPAQIIERVEIVKGAASSSWGQALGGVINVVTKTSDPNRRIGGMASISHGERGSEDIRGELSGSLDRFGYYVAGGYLGSDGFRPNTGFNANNIHAKLTHELPNQGQAAFSFTSLRNRRGDFAYEPLDYKFKDESNRQIFGLSLLQPLRDHFELEIKGRHSVNLNGIEAALLSTNETLQDIKFDERVSGGGIKLLWRLPDNLLVAGMDYDHARLQSNDTIIKVDLLNRKADRWGFYLNDTLTVGPLSFSPGLRYDLTGTSGDQFSPSFGVTLQIGDNTTLRGYTARGFSLPAMTLDRGSERVWTSQVGFETGVIPYLWLKGTLFRNDIQDISIYDSQLGEFRLERQIKQGVEIEGKTAPLYHTALSVGYNYVDARRASDNSVVKDVAPHTLHIGVHYDDHRWLRGAITGRHIRWNAESYHLGKYSGILWDAHLTASPFGRKLYAPELFFSLRNMFNGSQYLDEVYKNNGRRFEGGVRFQF